MKVKHAITGFAAGALTMYFADPNRGRRRRALTRDQGVATWNALGCEFAKAAKDFANRSRGLVATIESVWSSGRADAQLLEARVRSKIGRTASHPHAIHVEACEHGRVVLTGPILADEVAQVIRSVESVPGVREVVNRLDAHRERGNISSLQGGMPRVPRSEFLQEHWTPALRVSAGCVGGATMIAGMVRGGAMGWAGAISGAALLARATANTGFREAIGAGDGAGAVHIDKAIHILAPIEQVFTFWSKFENFPRFMSHLKEVRDLGNGRSHWVAAGPGGVSIPWEAEVTDRVENQLLVWRSVPGSLIRTSGTVRFDSDPDGGTRVAIRMSYTPPAGVFGHVVASLFGADPKSEIDDDLVRLKSLLELGKTRVHGRTVVFDGVGAGVLAGNQHAW